MVYYLNKSGQVVCFELGANGNLGKSSPIFQSENMRAFDADSAHVVAVQQMVSKVFIKQLTGTKLEKESEILLQGDYKLNHVLLARAVVIVIGYSSSSTLIQILDKKSLKPKSQPFIDSSRNPSLQMNRKSRSSRLGSSTNIARA
jgi:hypothetical protein